MSSLSNLNMILNGEKQRLADAEFQINYHEKHRKEAEVARDSAKEMIKIIERLIEKEVARCSE